MIIPQQVKQYVQQIENNLSITVGDKSPRDMHLNELASLTTDWVLSKDKKYQAEFLDEFSRTPQKFWWQFKCDHQEVQKSLWGKVLS